MKKYHLLFSIIFLLLISSSFHMASTAIDGIIGSVNGENLYKSDLERLFNSQKKKFYTDLNFNLFSPSTSNPAITLKREEQLRNANKEGLLISNEEFEDKWESLLKEQGGIENIERKAKENNLLIADIKLKLEENLLLEKHFELKTKETLTNSLIDEALVLQEAKSRNIQISNDEINQKIDLIKERQGGEEAFAEFLKENNATIDDAKNEIKKQLLYKAVKDSVASSGVTNFKIYLTNKKDNANIVIYKDKLFNNNEEKNELAENQEEIDSLRTKKYPAITKTKINELEELEKSLTADAELEQKQEISNADEQKNDFPLANPEQVKALDSQIKIKQEVLVKVETNDTEDNTLVEKTEVIKPDPEIKSNEKPIDVSEISEPVILKPVNQKSEEKVAIDTTMKKKKNQINIAKTKETLQFWGKTINQKLVSEPLKTVQNKYNEMKLAKTKKEEEKKVAQSLVPGEPIAVIKEEVQKEEKVELKVEESKQEEISKEPAPAPAPPVQPTQNETPQVTEKQNKYSNEINNLHVFKEGESDSGSIKFSKGLSEELKELIQKIDERRQFARK